jgi:hypothetical protein
MTRIENAVSKECAAADTNPNMLNPDSKRSFEKPNASHKLTTTTQKPQFEKDVLKYVNGTSQEENDMIRNIIVSK